MDVGAGLAFADTISGLSLDLRSGRWERTRASSFEYRRTGTIRDDAGEPGLLQRYLDSRAPAKGFPITVGGEGISERHAFRAARGARNR